MKNRIPYLPLLCCMFLLSFLGCAEKEDQNAQAMIDAAVAAHGGQHLDQSVVSFRFRDRLYRALRDNGAFVYSRTFTDDSTGQRIHDVLRNSGFERTMDDLVVELPKDQQEAYTASVNSVIYFALLPYFLQDDAVQSSYLGTATVKGQPYDKVRVTFAQDGGGEDFQDVFVYWFHQERHTLDYLAYSYEEENGVDIGTRFREATNLREVNGVRFQDYINYTATEELALENYDRAFEAGKLKKLSEINLEDVKVSKL